MSSDHFPEKSPSRIQTENHLKLLSNRYAEQLGLDHILLEKFSRVASQKRSVVKFILNLTHYPTYFAPNSWMANWAVSQNY